MKASWWMLAASIAIASPVGSYAADSTRSSAIGGSGRDACSAWVKDRSARSESAKQATQRRIEWVSGFFSAVNVFIDPSGNLHGSIDDLNGMLGWVDNYCRGHPSDPLFAVAADLFFDLRNHPRK